MITYTSVGNLPIEANGFTNRCGKFCNIFFCKKNVYLHNTKTLMNRPRCVD